MIDSVAPNSDLQVPFGSITEGGASEGGGGIMEKIGSLFGGGGEGGPPGGGGSAVDMSSYNGIPGLLSMMNQANAGKKQGGPRPGGPRNNPYIQGLMGG